MLAALHWLDTPLTAPYRWTMLGAIALSATYWFVKARRDPALLPVFIGALGGAFIGAKLAYLFAEGWRDWPMEDRWLRLAAGKSVIGGLLGGYGGVELMKWITGYQKSTGDRFALILPVGVALGRVGCSLQGCCLGKPIAPQFFSVRDEHGISRWPASQVELGFQLILLVTMWLLRHDPRFKNRLIFLYFISYGSFRFLHEFLRDEPPMFSCFTGYHILALITALVGWVMFVRRGNEASRESLPA